MNKLVLLVFLVFISVLSVKGQSLETKSISVFKNGQSFVVKEGTINPKDNIFSLTKLPPALFGTLWFSSDDEIKQVVSNQKKLIKEDTLTANNLVDLIRINKGKSATITTDNETFTGTIEDITAGIVPANYAHTATSYLTFKTNGKWLTIDINKIKTVLFDSKPKNRFTNKHDNIISTIDVHFATAGQKELEMIYLQKGITWTPTYLLEQITETKARVKLQAEVFNDLEDINGVDMDFVVGVPNFEFANRPATLVNIPNLLLPYPHQPSNLRFQGQAFANNTISVNQEDIISKSVTPRDFGYNVNEPEVKNDLYFYTINNITLSKGGSAHYPIFEVEVPIKHLYEGVLPASDLNIFRGQQEGYSFDEKKSEIIHTIEIQNNTKYPFTTGSIFMIDEQSRKPLAQSKIKYTPARQKAYIKVTKAPDVSVTELENLVKINKEVEEYYRGKRYKEIELKNEIKIVNGKNKTIDLVLNKSIQGVLKKSNTKYTKTSSIQHYALNPKENLKFEIRLKSGEEHTIEYTYKAWVRK